MTEQTPDPTLWVPRADYDRIVAESAERFRELTHLEQQDKHHRDQVEQLRVRFDTQEARLGGLQGILRQARAQIAKVDCNTQPLARLKHILSGKGL